MTELRGNRFGVSSTPGEILSLLENIAEVYGLCSPNQRQYYVWDWTTIRQINWSSVGSIKKYLGALRRKGLQPVYPSMCGADHLRIKNHYLGFYHKQGSIIKAFLNEDSYHRHLRGIKRFNEFDFCHITAPELQGYDVKPSPHTLESYIFGENYQMIPLDLEADLIKELAEFHFNQPKEIEVVFEEGDRQQIIENLKEHHLGTIDIDKTQVFLDRESWRVIEGEIHGDLNRTNLIKGKENVFLTDWEFFSRGPVAQDMVKLYFQANDDIRRHIIDTYQNKQEAFTAKNKTADFRSSLILYSIRTFQNLYQQSEGQFINMPRDPSLADKKTALLKKNLLESIQSLLVDYGKK